MRASLALKTLSSPPFRGFDPPSSESSRLRVLGLREGRGIAGTTAGIAAEILGLGDGEAGADQAFAKISAIHRHRRHGTAVSRRRREADLGRLRPEQTGGEILCRLAALPARTAALAQLAALESVDAKKTKIDGESVTVERPGPGAEALIGVISSRSASTDKHERREQNRSHHETISTSTCASREGAVET